MPTRPHPSWPRRLLDEWPALLLVLLAAGGWALWPASVPSLPGPPVPPPAAAAYVRLDAAGSALPMRPDHLAHPESAGFGPRGERAPRAPAMPGANRVAPPYLALPAPRAAPDLDGWLPPPEPLPALGDPAGAADPLFVPAAGAATGGAWRVRLAPSLERAGLRWLPPPGIATSAPGRAVLRLRVVAGEPAARVWVEEGGALPATRLWQTAFTAATASSNAEGSVVLEWGR